MPQNVSSHLFPCAPGVYWAGELVTWGKGRCRAQPGKSAGGPGLLLPTSFLRRGLSFLPRVLGLRLLCPSPSPSFQIPPHPLKSLFPRPHPAGPCPALELPVAPSDPRVC